MYHHLPRQHPLLSPRLYVFSEAIAVLVRYSSDEVCQFDREKLVRLCRSERAVRERAKNWALTILDVWKRHASLASLTEKLQQV